MFSLPGELLIIFSGGLLAAISGVWMIGGAHNARARDLTRRLARAEGKGGVTRAQAINVRREDGDPNSLLEKWAKRVLPKRTALNDRLSRTGLKITVGTYLAASGLVGVAVYLIVSHVTDTSKILVVLGAMTQAILLPHMVIGFLIKRRVTKFISQMPDAIELMVRGLRSGLPISQCIASVGQEFDGPVGQEFSSVTDGVRFGRTLTEALWETAHRLDIQEFKFFVISLSVQQETGGNLAETLANLADILRRRKQMKLKIKAMSSEARASAYILGSLPFLMFAIIYLMNPGYATQLFTDPRGMLMLIIGGVILVVGFGVMAKMVRFEI